MPKSDILCQLGWTILVSICVFFYLKAAVLEMLKKNKKWKNIRYASQILSYIYYQYNIIQIYTQKWYFYLANLKMCHANCINMLKLVKIRSKT